MAKGCPEHNADCGSENHKEHLCYFVSQGFHLAEKAEYDWLIQEPHFKCRHCGRAARCKENLCEPTELK
jgi:hypothetical protein